MIDQLQTIAELVARASWQASLLAAIVALVIWCFGERLAARWRYLLWSVVLVRMLLIVAPASSWSLYQLAYWPGPEALAAPQVALQTTAQAGRPTADPQLTGRAADVSDESDLARGPWTPAVETAPPELLPSSDKLHRDRATVAAPARGWLAIASLTLNQWLAVVWFAGVLMLSGRLLWTYLLLRRKLARCQPVQDEATLVSLESVRQLLGLRRRVELLVTAEPISPCVVDAWRPRLVVPELALTELDENALRQVFCHELAHVARGDLWTNWLMLIARSVHWFNPVAWGMVREMQLLREMACDERTLAVLDADQRQEYAGTILSLVGLLTPSPLAPGMVALFSSRARLARRIEHLARGSFGTQPARAIALTLLVILATVGLTDRRLLEAEEPTNEPAAAQTANSDQPEAEPAATSETKFEPATFELRGRTMKWVKSASGKREWEAVPIGNVDIELYRIRGLLGEPERIAESQSDAEGFYSFSNLKPSLWADRIDRIAYGLVLRAPDRPPTVHTYFDTQAHWPYGERVELAGLPAEVSGQVINEQGKPVAGAIVYRYGIHGEPVPGVQSATTDKDGRFAIHDLSISELNSSKQEVYLIVRHPDYPKLHKTVPAEKAVTLTMPTGCVLEGKVIDEATGKPAANMFVTAQETSSAGRDTVTRTDDKGRYKLVVNEGNYNALAESSERVTAKAITDLELLAGQTFEAPLLTVTPGGLIEGRVVNTKTGELVVDYRDAYPTDKRPDPQLPTGLGTRVAIGYTGPSYPPRGNLISQQPLARVDEHGQFRMRAAAGDNYPYLVNAHGQRMAWDTRKQPPVVVKTGETTKYDMLITPKPTDEEKMKVANEVVAALPKEMPQRVDTIIAEFRKLNHTVDETEIWSSLMRELVTIGPPAVPALCAELDATDQQFMLRRLAFALRAIGDPRAVPALIRAIPKTLQPPLSDYGMAIEDQELTKFMQQHDLDDKNRGSDFDLGRPVREVFGTLKKLTNQDFDDDQLYGVVNSEDPNGEAVQRKMYREQAEKWLAWWETHWREFTEDEAYSRVGLPEEPAYTPPPFAVVGMKPKLSGGSQGEVLSPPGESGAHFLDLDTGLDPGWPQDIPRSELGAEQEDFALWAAQNGVDLTCVTRKINEQSVYALRGFNMRLEEISLRDAKNLDRFLERGTLPTGKPVGELLLKLDEKTGRYTTGNAAFLYQTREGGLGLIELTDQVTEARDITGQIFTPKGVGFHKGVRFNHRTIVPGS